VLQVADRSQKTFKNCLYLFILINTMAIWVGWHPVFGQNFHHKQIALDRQLISNPFTVEGVGGGNVAASQIAKTQTTATGYCEGFVDRRPNHILTLNSFFEFLKIEVESIADTTILIQGPGGVWCNDDFNNANPTIEGQWQPGTYKIWIGSYHQNIDRDYRIKITDLSP
jgi:hypothetical protein